MGSLGIPVLDKKIEIAETTYYCNVKLHATQARADRPRSGPGETDEQDDFPTADTWDEWLPPKRLAALERLRHERPDAAREVVAAVAPTLPAQSRARLLEVLNHNLSEADAACRAVASLGEKARGLMALARFAVERER